MNYPEGKKMPCSLSTKLVYGISDYIISKSLSVKENVEEEVNTNIGRYDKFFDTLCWEQTLDLDNDLKVFRWLGKWTDKSLFRFNDMTLMNDRSSDFLISEEVILEADWFNQRCRGFGIKDMNHTAEAVRYHKTVKQNWTKPDLVYMKRLNRSAYRED
ncbi:MAG: hypothetical protein RLZZ609_1336 [Cyanobacteriota bacterium]|jgi:hypothetical protein